VVGFLSVFIHGTTYIPEMIWKDPDIYISTDACLEGTGGWCDSEYFSAKFPSAVVEHNHHINVLELLSILVALRLWYKKCSGLRLKFYCDNMLSVNLINSGRSKDPDMLAIIREVIFICASHNIQIMAVHLPGVDNRKSDLLSRAKYNTNFEEIMGPEATRLEVTEEFFDVKESW